MKDLLIFPCSFYCVVVKIGVILTVPFNVTVRFFCVTPSVQPVNLLLASGMASSVMVAPLK